MKLWTLSGEGAAPELFGPLHVGDVESFAQLRGTLEAEQVLEFSFDFWDVEDCCRINARLERLNKIQGDVYVIQSAAENGGNVKRRKLGDGSYVVDSEDVGQTVQIEEEATPVFEYINDDGVSEAIDRNASSRVSGLSEEDADLKATLIPTEVMDYYRKQEEKLRVTMKRMCLEDHQWGLRSWDHNGLGIVKLHCKECNKEMGGSSGDHSKLTVNNLFGNFKKSHLMSIAHIKNWCSKHGVKYSDHPQSEEKGSKAIILQQEDHRKRINEGLLILEGVNLKVQEEIKPFTVFGDVSDSTDMKCFWVKVRCSYCRDFFQLCPPKMNLESNLMNHLNGPKHAKAKEDFERTNGQIRAVSSGKRGRPTRSSSSAHANQSVLHSWFKGATTSSKEGESQTYDRGGVVGLMCWGFRGPTCEYGDKEYAVDGLLNDVVPGVLWYPEPYVDAIIHVNEKSVLVKGTFRHRQCSRISMSGSPFPNLTCSMCDQIPGCTDFRLRVVREERSLEKRGERTTGGGRRVGYLQSLELSGQSRVLAKKYRLEKLHSWGVKARIAQLKVKRPTLKEAAATSSSDGNLFKFCHNIIAAHRTGASGGNQPFGTS